MWREDEATHFDEYIFLTGGWDLVTAHQLVMTNWFGCWGMWVFPKIGVFTPNHPILIGFSITNHPFWGPTPIFGNTHVKWFAWCFFFFNSRNWRFRNLQFEVDCWALWDFVVPPYIGDNKRLYHKILEASKHDSSQNSGWNCMDLKERIRKPTGVLDLFKVIFYGLYHGIHHH